LRRIAKRDVAAMRARNVARDRQAEAAAAFVLITRVVKPNCVGFDANAKEESLNLRRELEIGNWSS
jgi:hypothetical protein